MLHQPPIKLTNKSRRSREFLTPNEIDTLMVAAKRSGRHKHRDHTTGQLHEIYDLQIILPQIHKFTSSNLSHA